LSISLLKKENKCGANPLKYLNIRTKLKTHPFMKKKHILIRRLGQFILSFIIGHYQKHVQVTDGDCRSVAQL
jgi:hypothetical protein